MAVKIVKGLKAIDNKIASFATNAQKVNEQAHAIAMAILYHAAPKEAGGFGHGDCTRALSLVRAMPASMRRTMLIAWFAKYSPIAVKLSDQGDAVGFNGAYSKLVKAEAKLAKWDLEGAAKEPFYLLAERNPEEKVIDLAALLAMVEGLAKRMEGLADKDGIDPVIAAKAKEMAGKVRTIN